MNEYYVRPTNGADVAGQGASHATAYATLAFAIYDVVATHGVRATGLQDRINQCDESTEVVVAAEVATGYGSDEDTPLRIEGYTSVAGDGGVGDLDGGGSVGIWMSSSAVMFKNLKMGNSGSANIAHCLTGDGFKGLNLELHTTTGYAFYATGDGWSLIDSQIHTITGTGVAVYATKHGRLLRTWINISGTGIGVKLVDAGRAIIERNFIATAGGHGIDGYRIANYSPSIRHNSFLGSSDKAINFYSSPYWASGIIENNLIDGFTDGIVLVGVPSSVSGNAVNVSGTAYSYPTPGLDEDNETLASSPFAKSGSNTYANRRAYFAATGVNTGYPTEDNLSKGAVQPASGGGSTTTVIIEDAPQWGDD